MARTITTLCWNFEANGGPDHDKRSKANRLLASLDPDLLFRQEMWGAWGADAKGKSVMDNMEEDLALRGWLGPSSHTAVFAAPALFSPVRGWPDKDAETIWKMPPTVQGLRYRPAGPDAVPLVCASYHHNYASSTQRHAEADWATTFADKTWTTPIGMDVKLPVLMGGDHNSYPVPGAPGDLPLPVLEEIRDRRHRVHRSCIGPDGTRRMCTCPDETLRTAGLEDVARHIAARTGNTRALARTVTGCASHGPDARVDRIYASDVLLPAVADVEVIEVPLDMSDHHIVRAVLDGDELAQVLTHTTVR
ncbi:endonuclease/exonuclease/phosphatase family protein [Streptomyces kronopolitis]|uniref:endonuclease/exonuclease/phosphatase family protein n=1 Tax=Streptomyces kronopolitis TaxID=1612435 RepID=UPI003D958F52